MALWPVWGLAQPAPPAPSAGAAPLCQVGLQLQVLDGHVVVRTDPRRVHIALYWRNAAQKPINRLPALAQGLAASGATLCFGMNAGMYHADFAPVGLLVQDGQTVQPINHGAGFGNFFLKPNGVVALDRQRRAVVRATDDYARWAKTHRVQWASQSGPMLLIGGRIHPAFKADSPSRLIRNGVCARDGDFWWVMSQKPENLFEMARFFRDQLGCTDALYLDGNVSSLYWMGDQTPQHASGGQPLGVMVGATVGP